MSLTQYYTATSVDGFIADPDNSLDWLFTRKREDDGPLNYGEFVAGVGAMAMGSTTYEWILAHEFGGKDPAEWKWPYDVPCWVFTLKGAIIRVAPLRGGSVVLVDESAEPVVAMDLTHGRCGEVGRIWRAETNSTMRPLRVAVVDVDAEDAFEVATVEDQQPVETLRTDGSDEALGNGIRSRRPHRRLHRPDALAA